MKLLITDIGGVMVKTDEAIISAIEDVFKELHIPKGSKEAMLKAFGTSLYDYILAYLPDDQKHRAKECYELFKTIYPEKKTSKMIVFPGVDETLKKLKEQKIKIAVLSCMIQKEVEVNLSLLTFKEFDLIFSLESYGAKRPRPNGLQMIMEKLGIKPQETAYIGDTHNDIRMAKNAGVTSIAITTGVLKKNVLAKEEPDYLIDTFNEIIKAF